jgi:hypothetical protein
MKKNLPKSTRKFIRREKARIHQEIFDQKEQKKLIDELYPVRKPPEQNKNKDKVSNKQKESF